MEIDAYIRQHIVVNQAVKAVNIIHVHGAVCIDNTKAVRMDTVDHIHNFKQFPIRIIQRVDTLNKELISLLFDYINPSENFIFGFLLDKAQPDQ